MKIKTAHSKLKQGFTLIELLVVIGILAVLLAITLIAINPAKQFAQANNTQRSSDVNTLLNAIHRGHGVEEVVQATRLIIEAGFTANVDFIFGMPGEDEEDINRTIALMKKLVKIGARVHSHTFMPLVGTPLSGEKPGVVDSKTRRLLESLRGKGLEYGDWKKQESNAEITYKFLSEQKQKRDPKLRNIKPFLQQ